MLDYLRIMLNARVAKMDERGASAVEYGLLIAGIAALIVVVVFAFGDNLHDVFEDTCKSVAGGTRLHQGLICRSDHHDRVSGPRFGAGSQSVISGPTRSREPMHEPTSSRSRTADERGASAVEYGLLIAGIVAMIVVVVFAFGGGARGMFHGSCSDHLRGPERRTCP